MYVSNTHLKPVLGIDIHFVNLPFPFVPLPHPYIGLVIDPFDYIPFIGATVKVNNVPRGNTDTAGMIITFVHIPFGAGFTIFPIIGHDSQNFFGSKTVSVDGAPMSGAGYMLMTCNDIGLPLSFRPGRKFIPIPSLYLPTSFCIPLQWGAPVMVGGPLVPNFSIMALLKAFAMGSFFKIFGKLGGKMLKKLNNKILKKSPKTQKLSNKLCKMGFEPVDLITGRVNNEYTDFELPGPIPLTWTRNWDSDSSFDGPLGRGVQHSFDRSVELWPEDEALSVTLADGRLAVFPLLQPGESFYHRQEKILLKRKQNGHFLLEDYTENLYLHFNHETTPGMWRLSFLEDYSGYRIQLHYTGKHLTAITDSAGRQLLLQLDTQRRITAVEVAHRNMRQVLVRYGYNENGDLVSIADALGQAVTIEYQDHLMVKKTDRNGQSFYWQYDEKRRCIQTWGDHGILAGTIQYYKGYNVVTNSLGEETIYFFDENNLCVQITDHYGNHQYNEYTEDFDLYREIDEEGNITGYAYDEKGRLKETILPDGNSRRVFENEYNQITLLINPDSTTQSFVYDENRRLSFVNEPDGNTVAYEYNEEGQLVAVVENNKLRSELRYDEDENLVELEMPNGGKEYWKYDALGRCIQSINAAGETRFMEYDPLDRLRSLHLPDGNNIKFGYNAYDEVISATDKYGTVSFEYTPFGKVSKRSQQNTEIRFNYDTEGRLRSVINEARKAYILQYNKRGEVIAETGFDGLQQLYDRDATGKITKVQRPGGRSTSYEYDLNGRIIRTEFHDGSWEIFNYDKNGNLREAINTHSTLRFQHSKLGMLLQEEQDGYFVNSEYDRQGARIRISSSLGADIQMQRNGLEQVHTLQAVWNERIWQAQLSFNKAGQELSRLMPGNLLSEWTYDQAGRAASMTISRNGRLQRHWKYGWDANDRLVNIFDMLSNSSTRFRHDSMGNLLFAQYADNSIIHRSMDKTGNLFETTERTDRKYDAAGALLESNKYFYRYDEEGNLISKTSKSDQKQTRYEWYANRLLHKVIRPDGKVVEFIYDALGRRIKKIFNGTITRWVWDGKTILHEWTYAVKDEPRTVVNEWGEIMTDRSEPDPVNAPETGGITWVYVADSGVPMARIEQGSSFSIITDQVGVPVEAYDESGKMVWERAADIYGRTISVTGDKHFVPFRYQGQYEDAETGLYYNRFRYYDPEAGGYISQDPITLQGGMSLYGYVHDPNAWVDELGLAGELGAWGEKVAAKYLQKQGHVILGSVQNASGHGFDLVTKTKDGNIHVIEVKSSQNNWRSKANMPTWTNNNITKITGNTNGHWGSKPLYQDTLMDTIQDAKANGKLQNKLLQINVNQRSIRLQCK
jgi:RHS repeat-associated protein